VRTGKAEGKNAKRHTSAEFLAFLQQQLGKARWAKEIHIVLDNLSAPKTKAVEEFLAQHPKLRFHFAPTYSSWLNQVELWFAKIQRDVISRGIFNFCCRPGQKATQVHWRLYQIGQAVPLDLH
jgi:transposase